MRHLVPLALLVLAGTCTAIGGEQPADEPSPSRATIAPHGRAVEAEARVGEWTVRASPAAPVDVVADVVLLHAVRATSHPGGYHKEHARVELGYGGDLNTSRPETYRVDATLHAPVENASLVPPVQVRVGADAGRIVRDAPPGHPLGLARGEAVGWSGGNPAAAQPDAPTLDAPAPLAFQLGRAHPHAATLAPAAPAPHAAPAHETAARAPAAPHGQGLPPAAIAAGAAAGALLLLAPVALYHRLRGARVLDQETRARLYAIVRDAPGIRPADAAARAGVDRKTAAYHLKRLAAEGLVVEEGEGRQRGFFATGDVRRDARAAIVAARGSAAEVLALVRAAPGLTRSDLAERLDVARATVRWHLARLEAAGLVRVERAARAARVYPEEGRPEAY